MKTVEIQELRSAYPVGTKVVLDRMDDTQAPPPGTVGVVRYVDDLGQIGVSWATGSSLSLIPEVDKFHIAGEDEGVNAYRFSMNDRDVVVITGLAEDARAFAEAKGADVETVAPCTLSDGEDAIRFNLIALRHAAEEVQKKSIQNYNSEVVAKWILKMTLAFSPNSFGIGSYRRQLARMLDNAEEEGAPEIQRSVQTLARADSNTLIKCASETARCVLRVLPCW